MTSGSFNSWLAGNDREAVVCLRREARVSRSHGRSSNFSGPLPFAPDAGIILTMSVWVQCVEVGIALQIRLGSRKGSTERPQTQGLLPKSGN